MLEKELDLLDQMKWVMAAFADSIHIQRTSKDYCDDAKFSHYILILNLPLEDGFDCSKN